MSQSTKAFLLNLKTSSGDSTFQGIQVGESGNLSPSFAPEPDVRRAAKILVTIYDEVSPFGLITMSRKLLNPVKFVQFLAIVTVISLCLSVSARERRQSSSYDSSDEEDDLLSCPFECDCKGLTVDCANRGLKFVPKNIPSDAKRV